MIQRMQTELEGGAGVACKLPSVSVVSGTVRSGSSRGKSLGFPTANLEIEGKAGDRVAPGVYAAWVVWETGPRFAAVANVGCRPTFDEGEVTFEVHVLDFTGDLYGKVLEVTLALRLRDEMRFEDVEALVAQIGRDIEQARSWLSKNEVHH